MDRGKLYKTLIENEELDSEALKIVSEHIWSAKPSVIINYISNKPSIDFKLGGDVSECFEDEEYLSGHGGEVRYIAKVVSDKYVLDNTKQLKFFSSKFRLEGGFQGLYTVDNVDLYGSELTTTTPPSISCINLENHSRAIINLKEHSKHGGIKLSGIAIKGKNTEIIMKAEVEDKIKEGKFYLWITGENSRAELDLRKLELNELEVFFNHSGPNHHIHLKVSSNTKVNFGFWNGDPKGVKVIIEGGGSIVNASELINNGVDYEQR